MADSNKVEDHASIDADDVLVEEGYTLAVGAEGRMVVEDGSLPALDKRPGKSADRADWVDYAVSLGADRHYLENDTVHVEDATVGAEVVVESAPLTVSEVKDLVKHLGG